MGQYLGDKNKFVNRGLIWTIGSIGGWEALKLLVAYGMKKPDGKEVKPNLLAEAIGLALNSMGMWGAPLDYLAEKDGKVRELTDELRPGYVFDPKYYVFHPGYFSQQVEKRGLKYSDYERLYRSPDSQEKRRR